MTMGRQYKNAPIVEAIVEFKVDTPEDLAIMLLADLELGDEFTNTNPTYQFQGSLEVEPDSGEVKSAGATSTHLGFTHDTAEREHSVLTSPTSYAFVSRTSYTHWGDFITEAERLWEVYKAAAAPRQVTAIGVRFVNHIPMPTRPVEIKDYLRTSVDLSAYLPQAVSSLFMQVDVPLDEFGVTATITSAILDQSSKHPGGALLLDIDVKAPLQDGDTAAPGFNQEVTSTLTKLRLAKNFVFEACITDATRGVIDGYHD
jgi:uncharacterized protein (TIGR04255 family)